MQINRLKTALTGLAAAVSIALASSPAASADNALVQSIDAVYNLRDQLQDVVRKSVKGVAEAMDEGGAKADPPGESMISYHLRKYSEIDRLHKLNATNSKAQLELLKVDTKLLKMLPKDDPGRAAILKELGELPAQNLEVNKKLKEYAERRKGFHDEIQKYKKRTGSYPPHNCATAPGWHLPEGASCDGASIDPQGSPTPSPAPSGHGP